MHAGVCLLDRDRDLAVVTRFAFLVPYTRKNLSLSNIDDVAVKRRDHRKVYYVYLSPKRGTSVAIGAGTKEETIDAARSIREFLKRDQPHSGQGVGIGAVTAT